MVEKELVRDSNSLRDNFSTLINTKDIMNRVEIQMNFDLVFLYMREFMKVGIAHAFPTLCFYVLDNNSFDIVEYIIIIIVYSMESLYEKVFVNSFICIYNVTSLFIFLGTNR